MLSPAQYAGDAAAAPGLGDRTRYAAPVSASGPEGAQVAADVLAINRVGFLGGVERVILTAAESARRYGWATALACPAGELAHQARTRQMAVREVDVCPLSLSDLGKTPLGWVRTAARLERGARAILRTASGSRARILHAHHPASVLQARRAARRLQAALIWHVHETAPIPRAYRALARAIVGSCDMILCVSAASRDMVQQLGAPAERIRLLYNAVDARFFEPVRSDLGAPADGLNVGIFGVLEPRKGHADLIRACAALTERRSMLHVWIVGGASFERFGSYPAELQALARGLGVADRIHFLGPRDDVPELMSSMDAVVMASIGFESLPTVLLEASALGVPVLGTDVGGTREIIRHGETGLLAPPASPAALAENLDVLLSPFGRNLASRARAEAQRRFSPARFGADLDDCYRRLAPQRERTS